MPKRDVKNRVALKAVLRPIRSEPNDVNPCALAKNKREDSQVPQPTAPIIIPANIEEDKIPIRLSGTGNGAGDQVYARECGDMVTCAKSDVVPEGVL